MTVAVDPLLRFLEVARREPDAAAVEHDGEVMSYSELAMVARRVAAACAEMVEHPRVLIHLPQGAPAYAAMFGTLMAGGYYSPVNLDHPAARQRNVFRRFQPHAVVGTRNSVSVLDLPATIPLIDIERLPRTELSVPAAAHDLAYVMFTSGSTGKPKGVMIGRDGSAHYTAWALGATEVTPEDRWSQHPNIGFLDLSVLDIYGALCGGATLVPVTGRRARLLPGEAIREKRLTIWNSVSKRHRPDA